MDEYFQDFVEKTGIQLKKEDQEKYDDLNSLPAEIIDEARGLQFHRLAVTYLQYLTSKRNRKYLQSFVSSIVFGDDTIEFWGYQPYIAPDTSLEHQLKKNISEIFQNFNENLIAIFTPDFKSWKAAVSQVGSPIVIIPEADYTFETPPGFSSYSRDYQITLIRPSETTMEIAFRRWIAQRIARYFYKKENFLTFNSPQILHDIAPFETWTEDAKKAFQGLLRERDEIGWKEGEVPGYVGPDEFYN